MIDRFDDLRHPLYMFFISLQSVVVLVDVVALVEFTLHDLWFILRILV